MESDRNDIGLPDMEDADGMIFDFDGTLADSMGVWKWVDDEFLRRRALPKPRDYDRTLSTLGFISAADYVIERFSLNEEPEDIMDEWNSLALERYSTAVRFKPHAIEYLEKVRDQGMRTSIATTLSPTLLDAALSSNEAVGYFDGFATGYDVKRDKREPDIYLLAAQLMDVTPMRCIVFEDILPGIRSAKRAGMRTVAVRDDNGHQETEALIAEADLFIDGFDALVD